MRIIGFGHTTYGGGIRNMRPNGTILFEQTTREGAPGQSPLKVVVAETQRRIDERFYAGPMNALRVCGEAGGMPCSVGTPQSALRGLGAVESDIPDNRTFPLFCAPVRLLLAEMKWLLDKATTSTPTVARAQVLYNEFDSYTMAVPGTSQCADATAVLRPVVEALRSEVAASTGTRIPQVTPDSAVDPNAGGVNPLVTVAVVGGIAVVGVLGIGWILSNVAKFR